MYSLVVALEKYLDSDYINILSSYDQPVEVTKVYGIASSIKTEISQVAIVASEKRLALEPSRKASALPMICSSAVLVQKVLHSS
jgi:hypothetical protein